MREMDFILKSVRAASRGPSPGPGHAAAEGRGGKGGGGRKNINLLANNSGLSTRAAAPREGQWWTFLWEFVYFHVFFGFKMCLN